MGEKAQPSPVCLPPPTFYNSYHHHYHHYYHHHYTTTITTTTTTLPPSPSRIPPIQLDPSSQRTLDAHAYAVLPKNH